MSWEKVTHAGGQYLLHFIRSSPSGSVSSGWETIGELDEMLKDETFVSENLVDELTPPATPRSPPPSLHKPTTLISLPPELLLLIAESLPTACDLLNLTLTSHHLHALVTPTLHHFALTHHTLTWAARKGHLPLVRLHLIHGTPPDTRPSIYSASAIHYAAGHNHPEIIALLLSHGANINIQGASGQTALHLATLSGHAPTVRLLIDNGADIDMRNAAGLTALLLGVRYPGPGDDKGGIVRMLLEAGAAVDVQERYVGWTALHWAVGRGRVEVVKELLERGAEVGAMTRAKETPVHWALKRRDAEMVVLLLEKGLRERWRGK